MKRAVLSLLVFGAALSAAPVSVTFVSGGNDAQGIIGPYTLKVDGKTVQAMCMDDFLYASGTWTANVTSANSLDLSNTYLGGGKTTIGGKGYTDNVVYRAEAYLFSLIVKPQADRADIQQAAWGLMDSNTYKNLNTNAHTFATQALYQALNFDASGYSILSQAGHHNEQEFIYATATTPEPASAALLGGGFLLAGASRWLKRRKTKAAIA